MLSPSDLDLPGKFSQWRPGQLETSAKIAASQKYAFLLDAPTGSGKSLIGAAAQRLSGRGTTYICTTKQLQDQLLHDFPYAKTLKGRSNYVCLKHPRMFPNISAEDCTHSEINKCELWSRCPYVKAKRAALEAPLAVLNTAYFLSEANYVGGFSHRELLIVDEFDSIEDQLMSFIEVVITQRQLSNLNVAPPRYKTKFESWVTWAENTLTELRPQLRQLESELGDAWSTDDFSILKTRRNLKRLVGKLEFFVREVDKTWVWYPGEDRWVFKPVWISRYSNATLWKHADRILGMSATILDPRQVCVNTGLTLGDRKYDYIALPSPFPKEHRPIYYEPCADVVNKKMDIALPKLAKAVENILNRHPEDRILIHTVSYKVKDYLQRNVSTNRFITHSVKDRAVVLENFKKSSKPLVLLSPSMGRGVDLPDDQCRVVVVAKCPYPDLGDPQVSRRMYGSNDGGSWYAHRTASSIIQMSGRACRSTEDYSITYILDQQFDRLFREHGNIFPKWWKESVIW